MTDGHLAAPLMCRAKVPVVSRAEQLRRAAADFDRVAKCITGNCLRGEETAAQTDAFHTHAAHTHARANDWSRE